MNAFRLLLLGACVFGLSFTGCDSADPGANDGQPALISPDAFAFADADFPDVQGRGIEVGANFSNAALRVGVVNLAVGLNLLIPHLATQAALNADAEIESGTWVWSNMVRVDQEDVTFALSGTPDGNGVDWSMRITTASPISGEVFEDFEIYTAQTAFDGRSGSWQLYHEVEGERKRVLEASFDVDSEDERQLTFSVPAGFGERGGDAVVYSVDGDARAFDWTQVAENFEHYIEWDAVSFAGSIEATNYNGGERACWNAGFEDVPCN